MRAQTFSYRNLLNVLLDDVQLRSESLSNYHVYVGEDGHSLHLRVTDSDDKGVGHTTSTEDDSDVLKIPSPPVASYFSPSFCYYVRPAFQQKCVLLLLCPRLCHIGWQPY